MQPGSSTPKGGFLLYPRAYHLDESDPARSFVDGVTRKGREIRVHLQPTEEMAAAVRDSSSKTLPDLARFAQSGRRAKNPCAASADNGPDAPCGILLIEQVFEIDRANNVWGGRWASVLRAGPEDAMPAIGIGYLEMNVFSRLNEEASVASEEMCRIRQAIDAGTHPAPIEGEERISALRAQVLGAQTKRFTGVILRPHESLYLPVVTPEALAGALRGPLEHYTRRGMYGGALIRVRRDLVVDSKLSTQIDMQYHAAERRVKSFDEVFADFLRYQAKGLLAAARRDANVVVEIIPMLRINCAKHGNERYGNELARSATATPKIVKTFVDREHQQSILTELRRTKGYLASQVAIRVAEIYDGESAGNLILSSIHAFSPAIGNPYEIDPTGRAAYTLDTRKPPAGHTQNAA
ncbi:hypothetical protein J2T57_001262 [Natronocella acetinitrilica]|uniref:Uncharacterized protein n=1 Tax=Natronocella acetinitrilica TaxID=414046 RepID=A0AAE3G1X5_9GAMM|nr:hypothetical protein [Natronocella acetinitrilica]MCP1674160.1 hypothetical protein [Natronocella acetinitrilica]